MRLFSAMIIIRWVKKLINYNDVLKCWQRQKTTDPGASIYTLKCDQRLISPFPKLYILQAIIS